MTDTPNKTPLARYAAARLAATLSPAPFLERMPYSIHAEYLSIPTADGVSLGTTLLTRGRRSLVIVGHGFASTQQSRSVVWLAEQVAEHHDVLTFDWRGYGRSGGLATFGGHEAADLAAVIAWARDYGYQQVSVVAESMGGLITLAALGNAEEHFPLPDRIVTLSAPGDYALTGGHRPYLLRYVAPQRRARPIAPLLGFRMGEYRPPRPLDVVERIRVPWLLVHGTRDSTVPYRNAELLYEAAPHAALRRYEGADHAITGLRAYDAKRLLADLREHLD
jgi:pimeloyl-ACP methyl ester carboxylesterase